MMMSNHMESQYKNEKEKADSIKYQLPELTRDFCISRISKEYADLCLKLIEKLARKRFVPFISGKVTIWAASIIRAIERINFLGDKNFEPYLELGEIAKHFDTSKSTVGQKATKTCDMLNLQYYDPDFSTSHMAEQNPFAWMVRDQNGFIHIVRD